MTFVENLLRQSFLSLIFLHSYQTWQEPCERVISNLRVSQCFSPVRQLKDNSTMDKTEAQIVSYGILYSRDSTYKYSSFLCH